MTNLPVINVQLVHIQGPMKGEIQEFSESTVSIGRNPACNVCFPKDLTSISRIHAQIIREGNRFKLVDLSINGTFVNGKRVEEGYLKDGDVLIFSEDGPKVSFLTKMTDRLDEAQDSPLPSPPKMPEMPIVDRPYIPPAQPEKGLEDKIPIQKVQVPLIIQFGPTLRSFRELPVILGKNPDCDFTMNHPAVLDRHCQFFFDQNNYWVKDLTGRQMISINGQLISNQAPLNQEDLLALGPEGPHFLFLGEGRLAEFEELVQDEPIEAPRENKEMPAPREHIDDDAKRKKSVFKKLFRG
jgi:pSer/pThr/pTyr-binding forkhead associated (FHA) protein